MPGGEIGKLAFGVILAMLSAGPTSGQVPEAGDLGPIRNSQPGFLVRAEVNHATRDYREGDALSVRVASEEAAFVYVLYRQADGRVFQVFPNTHQPDNYL